MNPDLYSDIKQSERLFFEPSVYLLSMFENKIDSLFSDKPRHLKKRERMEDRDEQHTITFSTRKEDPLKQLGTDLTKPIWNCQTKTQPVAICAKPRTNLSDPNSEVFNSLSYLFIRFLEKYSNQHQDESNLKVHVRVEDRELHREEIKKSLKLRQPSQVKLALQQLFQLMGKLIRHQDGLLKEEQELMDSNDGKRWNELHNQAARTVLTSFFDVDQNAEYINTPLASELITFTSDMLQGIRGVIECRSGPTLLNIWPETGMMSELVHPVMLGLFTLIKEQSGALDEMPPDTFSRLLDNPKNIVEEDKAIFDQLKSLNCSKITFLNLDGFESKFNLILAKYFHRYLQYVSFPLETETCSEKFAPYFRATSTALLREYLGGAIEGDELRRERRVFQLKEGTAQQLGEYYRNLLVLPLNSLQLREGFGLGGVELLQSWGCSFLMKEVVIGEMRAFNPSVVVISYSSKLQLTNEHFEEILREVTVLSNMKVLLYNNCTRAYTFHQYQPDPSSQALFNYHCIHKYEHKMHDQMMCPYRASCLDSHQQLNYDLLHKHAIFLKVTSGTTSLSPEIPLDSSIIQFANQQVMKYVGGLLRVVGQNHPTLNKYINRGKQYLRIEKMLAHHHRNQHKQETHPAPPSAHAAQLLTLAQKALLNKQASYQHIAEYAERIYGSHQPVRERWEEFKHFWVVQSIAAHQQSEHKTFLHLPRHQPSQDDADRHSLIAIEFELDGESVGVVRERSQVCVSSLRSSKSVLVYLFNHLPSEGDIGLKNYVGIMGSEVEESEEGRVVLGEVAVKQQRYNLSPFQHFTQFNYHQTTTSVILYWPTIYDQVMAMLHQFVQRDYHPIPTNLIFVSNKHQPNLLGALTPLSCNYERVLPRSNCTSFQVPGTDYVYIFGGFYQQDSNYLLFQKDITLMRYIPNTSLQVETVPKQFHFDYELVEQPNTSLPHFDSRKHRIKHFRNDLVRPRAEYQILPLTSDPQEVEIMLFGGLGQKFMQPYSLIGYMGHRITFRRTGELVKVQRCRLNNLVPINLKGAVRTKTAMDLPTVLQAQNRHIYTEKQTQEEGTACFSWFNMNWSEEEQRMTFKKQYEMCVVESDYEEQHENSVMIRQSKTKVVLRHYQGRRNFDNMVVVSSEQGPSQLLRVDFRLTEEAYSQFVNMQKPIVPVNGGMIVAADTIGVEMYAVLHHQDYTFGKYLLAYCDLTSNLQGLLDSNWLLEEERPALQLQEIYQFDGDMDRQALIALPQRQLALLYGYPFSQQSLPLQTILTRTRHGSLISRRIHTPHRNYPQFHPLLPHSHSNCLSFFAHLKQRLYCWTIYTTAKHSLGQQVILLVEEVNLGESVLEWRYRRHKPLKLVVRVQGSESMQIERLTILDIKCTGNKYELLVGWGKLVFFAPIDLFPQGDSPEVLPLSPLPNRSSLLHYQEKRSTGGFNTYYLPSIHKNPHNQEDPSTMDLQHH